MYFVTKKSYDFCLIGVFGHHIYSVERTKEGFNIYRKCIFDIGRWELFQKISINLIPCNRCSYNMQLTAGIIDSKIWIVAMSFITNEDNTFPVLISVDLNTNNITKYNTKDNFYNYKFAKHICLTHNSISFEGFNDKNNLFFYINENRLYPRHDGDTERYTMRILDPNLNVLYFVVNEELEECEFGECASSQRYLENICTAEIKDNKFWFSLLKSGVDGFTRESGAYPGEYICYNVINFLETDNPENDEYIQFYRPDGKHELHCMVNKKIKENENYMNLKIYKVNINFEEESVFFELLSSFNANFDYLLICQKQIFTTPHLFVFQTDYAIHTVINRILTLSESAYMVLAKMPKPVKRQKNIFFQCFKNHIAKRENAKIWMSMEYLQKSHKFSKSFHLFHDNF